MIIRAVLVIVSLAIALAMPAQAWFKHGGGGPSFYFSTSGSDSNPCTQALPCASIAKANSLTYPPGVTLFFKAGDTFTLSTAPLQLLGINVGPNLKNVFGAVKVTTYGGGTCDVIGGTTSGCATFQVSGSVASGIAATAVSNLVISNIRTLGNTAASLAWGNYGANGGGVVWTMPGGTNSNITIQNVEAEGFSFDIVLNMQGGTVSTVNVLNNYVHGASPTATDDSGITTLGGLNIVIQGNLVKNIGGKAAGLAGTSGNGIIVLNNANGVVDQYNVTGVNGANVTTCGGPVGNWTYDSSNVTIQFNESYNNAPTSFTTGCDWDGFDLDSGVSNSFLQYNYSHGNYGAGFNASMGTVGSDTWHGNQIRYNISEKDDAVQGFGAFSFSNSPGTNAGSAVYNNTIYTHSTTANSTTASFCLTIFNTTTTIFANNICYNDNGNPFINAPGAATINYNDYFRTGTVPTNPWKFNNVNYTSFAAYQSGSSQDANGTTANPGLASVGTGGTCYVSGAPTGPQPCPVSAYALTAGSAMIGAGANMTPIYGITPPARDYFGNTIPHTSGTHYNIGADGSNPGTVVPGLPIISAVPNLTAASGVATPVTGISLAETNPAGGETFTMGVSDTNGIITATGTGVSGSGTNTLTIGPTTLANVNTAAATVAINASANDTIALTAHDTISGGVAVPVNIAVTVTGGGSSYSGPGDIVAAADSFWSLRAYSNAIAAAHTAKLINVRNTSTNEQCDVIVATSGGFGNVANCTGSSNGQTPAVFCAASGGACTVTRLYDQIGGHDVAQATTANQPALLLSGCPGFSPCMSFNGSTSDLISVSSSSTAQPLTLVAVADLTNNTGGVQCIECINGVTFSAFTNANVFASFSNPTGLSGAAVTTGTLYPLSFVANGASSSINVANSPTPGTLGTTAFPATFGIGSDFVGCCLWQGFINEVGLWPVAFNATQIANVCVNQQTYFNTTSCGVAPALPVIAAPPTVTVPSNVATTVPGISVSKSGALPGDSPYTALLQDATGILNANGGSVSPSPIDPGSSGCGANTDTSVNCVQTINAANEILVAFIATNGGPVTGITDSLSLTWIKRAGFTVCTAWPPQVFTLEEWYAIGPSGGSFPRTDTVTTAISTGNPINMNIAGVMGANLSSPFDAVNPSTVIDTCAGAAHTITYSTQHANTVAFGAFRNNTNATPAPAAQWTALPNNTYMLDEYQVFNAQQANIIVTEAPGAADVQGIIADAIVLNSAPITVLGGGTTRMQIGPTSLANLNTVLATVTVQASVSDVITINAQDNLGQNALQQQANVAVGSTPPGVPIISVPSSITVPSNITTAIAGASLSETNPAPGETFTEVLSDTAGTLTATGTGVSGSGTHTLTIGPTSLANVNTALATLAITATVNDTMINVTASDSVGGIATPKNIAVTVTGTSNTYFVAANGSDSNNGTSTATPWQTIGKVNATSLVANPTVSFRGGDTFSGGIVIHNDNQTITSYGTGQATVSSGNSAACVSATNFSATIVNNIICIGGGNSSSTTDGISILNTSGSSITGPTVTNNTVSGYGANGILLKGAAPSVINGFNISNNTVHDSTGNGGILTACIKGWDTSAHTYLNGTIANNLVFNCTGQVGQSNWSGSGIMVDGADNVMIQGNVAHDNGTIGQGSTGIWTANSNNITIQLNESYNNSSNFGTDGDGFDLDGDTTSSVMQYNYAHTNLGSGFLLWTGSFGGGGHTNNTMRYNISENDGTRGALGDGGLVIQGLSSAATDFVYGNTFYSTNTFCGYVSGSGTYRISNNIFYCTHQFGATNIGTWLGNDYFGGVSITPGDTAALTADPKLTGAAGTGGTCYSSGTPTAPQPCPAGYSLQAGSPMIGTGQNLNTVFGINTGSRDYFNNPVPNIVGSGYNIGADNHAPQAPGLPVIAAPATLNVSSGNTQTISGLSLSEVNPVTNETFTEVLSDTVGTLTAIGTGVSGSGTHTLTIGPVSLTNMNSALATVAINTTANDTVHITAHDTISGGLAVAKNITVTIANGAIAQSAFSFIDSIGLNVHIAVNPGLYTFANITSGLNYIGTRNIRDYQYNNSTNAVYNALGDTIRASTIKFASVNGCSTPKDWYLDFVFETQWVALFPNALKYLEGSNETNNFPVCFTDNAATTVQTNTGGTVLNFAADSASGPFPMTEINAITTGTPGGSSYGAGVIVTDFTAGGNPNIDNGSAANAEAQTGVPGSISVTQIIGSANELLVACVVSNIGPTQITDTLGLTWTKRASSITGGVDTGGSGVFPFQQEEWVAVGPTSGSFPRNTTITDQPNAATIAAGYEPNSYQSIGVFGIIGANTSSPFDGSPVIVNDPAQISTGPMTISTTHANTMVLGCGRDGAQNPTAGPGFTAPFSGFFSLYEYATFSSPQTGLTVDDTPSGGWQGSIADAIVLTGPPGTSRVNPIPAGTTIVTSTPTSVTLSQPVTANVLVGDIINFTANANHDGQGGKSNPASSVGTQAGMNALAKRPGSAVANKPVLNFTDFAAGEPRNGNIGVPGTADFNNQHPYPCGGGQPALTVFNPAQWINQGLFALPGKLLVITEGGYPTVIDGSCGVDRPTQAVLLTNYFLDAFKIGNPNTYTYEMYDNACGASDAFNNYGVFDCNTNPKPAATALKNLIAILSDSSTSFSPGALNYSVSGLPAYDGNTQGGGYSLLLQKTSGNYYIVVWNEPQIWTPPNTEITPPNLPITVNFGTTFGTVNVYDPLSGTSPISTASNVSLLNTTIAKDPLILELIPASGGGGPNFFFSSSGGNDGNNCTSAVTACATIAKLNSLTYPAGATINLKGGDTFVNTALTLTATNAPSGTVSIVSYGAGQATISSGNSAQCVLATNVPAVTINNIVCTGGGITTSTTSGIEFDNTGSVQLAGPTITNTTISGYGFSGIVLAAASTTVSATGYNNITITNNIIHDATGHITESVGGECIAIWGNSGANWVYPNPGLFTNITIQGNLIYNCTPPSGLSQASGGGIVVAESTNVQIRFNVAHDTAGSSTCAHSGGTYAIWDYDATNVLYEFNEAYHTGYIGGVEQSNVCDAGAFDMDAGTHSSTMQYNYGHDNFGPCVLLAGVNDGTTWSNNTFRYNVCENNINVTPQITTGGTITIYANAGTTMTGAQVYNNTCYAAIGNKLCLQQTQTGTSGGTIANNIFYGSSGSNAVSVQVAGSLSFVANDYFPSQAISWNGTSYSTVAAWQTATGQEKIGGVNVSKIVDPLLTTPGSGGTCYSSGTPGGPQPCPGAYALQSGSPMIGVGVDLTASPYLLSVGTRDYYSHTIPHTFGTHYNIGADGGNPGSPAPGLPIISAGTNLTVSSGVTTPVSGISLSETNPAGGETFTMGVSDTNGTLTASGTGVSGSGTKTLTIGPTTLANVNTAAGTVAINTGTSDTIALTAHDTISGGVATPVNIAVAVSGGGSNFFFSSSSGNDSNNCTSAATACATINKLNSINYPNGATISLKAGDTWSAGTTLALCGSHASPPGGVASPCTSLLNVAGSITVGTYGGGSCNPIAGMISGCATLQASGSQTVGVWLGGLSNVTVQNLRVLGNTTILTPTSFASNCTGSGYNPSSSYINCNVGINYSNHDTTTSNITITNNEVSGWSWADIDINGILNPPVLSSNVTISNNYVHGLTSSSVGWAGMQLNGMQNSLVQGNLVINIGGGQSTNGGQGIYMNTTRNTVNQFNVTHDNSFVGQIAAGNWISQGQGVTFQFNESYNTFNSNVADGEGFDLDCGTSQSIMQFNYSHANVGPGFYFYTPTTANYCTTSPLGQTTYRWGGSIYWGDNQMRYNISEADFGVNAGQSWSNTGSGRAAISIESFDVQGQSGIYNNTIYTHATSGDAWHGLCLGTNSNSSNIKIYNNICYNDSGNPFINTNSGMTGLDYNNYFRTGVSPPSNIQWNAANGVNQTTLAGWRGSSNDAHGLNVNPSLAGTPPAGNCYSAGIPAGPQPCPGSYALLAGSPMVGVGADLSGSFTLPTQDYFGHTVPHTVGTHYNIGADGNNPNPGVNCVLSITVPGSLTATQNVGLAISNIVGADTSSPGLTSVTMTFTDTFGNLSFTGTGITNNNSHNVSITGLGNVVSAMSTLVYTNSTVNPDAIFINLSDNLGCNATQKSVAITTNPSTSSTTADPNALNGVKVELAWLQGLMTAGATAHVVESNQEVVIDCITACTTQLPANFAANGNRNQGGMGVDYCNAFVGACGFGSGSQSNVQAKSGWASGRMVMMTLDLPNPTNNYNLQLNGGGGISSNTCPGNTNTFLGSTYDCTGMNTTVITQLVTPGTTQNTNFNTLLSHYVPGFLDLQNNGVMMLMRMFHEADGTWFWYGTVNANSSQQAALYQYVETYFEGQGIHNILYVYCSAFFVSGYPGNQFVDIVAFDNYNSMSSQQGLYNNLASTTKPVITAEWGCTSPCSVSTTNWDSEFQYAKANMPHLVMINNWWGSNPGVVTPSNTSWLAYITDSYGILQGGVPVSTFH